MTKHTLVSPKWRLFKNMIWQKMVWGVWTGWWTTTGGDLMHTQHSQERYCEGKSWNNFGLGITKLLLQRLMGFKYLCCFIYILFCESFSWKILPPLVGLWPLSCLTYISNYRPFLSLSMSPGPRRIRRREKLALAKNWSFRFKMARAKYWACIIQQVTADTPRCLCLCWRGRLGRTGSMRA